MLLNRLAPVLRGWTVQLVIRETGQKNSLSIHSNTGPCSNHVLNIQLSIPEPCSKQGTPYLIEPRYAILKSLRTWLEWTDRAITRYSKFFIKTDLPLPTTLRQSLSIWSCGGTEGAPLNSEAATERGSTV